MAKQVLTKHGLDANKDVNYLDVGQGNQLTALLGGGFDAAILSVEQRYVALDKGMREMFFMGNEVKNSWGTLATTDKLIKENPKMVAGFVRATIKALRYLRHDKEGTVSAMLKFSGVSRQQATRVYDDIIGTFTSNGVVDDETQRNDLAIIRQVVNTSETLPNARAYDFSFALDADQQLNRSGWKP
jgi:ABC-type nitrate/sulfonate/bicarbonate transport system substrate-binding protein